MKKRQKLSITPDEWIVIGSIAALATVFMGLLPIMMNSTWFLSLVPPLQYLFYNIGFMLLTILLLGVPIAHAQERVFSFWTMIRSGLSSWLIFSFILDIWQPPFSFDVAGDLLNIDSHTLVGTSVDYMLGWTYQTIIHPTLVFNVPFIGHVSVLFLLIYFFTPICAIILSALLLKPGFLMKMFGSEVL